MKEGWNPWHGCHRLSEGCAHCYVYRIDAKAGRDASVVAKTAAFDLPVRKDRKGHYKFRPEGFAYTCFSSDFFVEEADAWRPEAWAMIKERSDLAFFMVTKRIARFIQCIPPDWEGGYPNVHIACTVENQRRADERMPFFINAPIRHKYLVCEPLLERIDFKNYLTQTPIVEVIAGGESGPDARLCDFEWVQDILRQCKEANVSFGFKQTGALFKAKGRIYKIPRHLQSSQARKSGAQFTAQAD